jgi:hypothetical protein
MLLCFVSYLKVINRQFASNCQVIVFEELVADELALQDELSNGVFALR